MDGQFSDLVTYLVNLQHKQNNGSLQHSHGPLTDQDWEVLALNVSPEMGERIMISGLRDTIEELFPEISPTLQDTRHSLAWNSSSKFVIRWAVRETEDRWRLQSSLANFSYSSTKYQGVKSEEILDKVESIENIDSVETKRVYRKEIL